jgi:tetratricopeptide (TPR) repeat protein
VNTARTRRPGWRGPAGGLLVVLAASSTVASAQKLDVKDLLGQRVVTTRTTPLRDGSKLIERDGLFRVYTVDGARPGQVHIVSGGIGLWIAPGQVVPLDQAIDYFSEKLRQKPTGELYNKRGLVYHELKDYDHAIADFDEAIKRESRYAVGHNNRGLSLQFKGEYARAIADYDRAVELDPKLAMAFGNRGLCHQNEGHYDKALADYDRALQLDPKAALVHANRAILLATCPDPEIRDPKQAVDSASRACELTAWKDAGLLHVLAGSHAAAGGFDSAAKWEAKALELAPEERKDEFRARLEHYRAAGPSGP